MKVSRFDIAMLLPFVVLSLIFLSLMVIINVGSAWFIWGFLAGYLGYQLIKKYWQWVDKKKLSVCRNRKGEK